MLQKSMLKVFITAGVFPGVHRGEGIIRMAFVCQSVLGQNLIPGLVSNMRVDKI